MRAIVFTFNCSIAARVLLDPPLSSGFNIFSSFVTLSTRHNTPQPSPLSVITPFVSSTKAMLAASAVESSTVLSVSVRFTAEMICTSYCSMKKCEGSSVSGRK